MSKIERLRFTISDDLILLREVLGQNPFEDAARWKEIHENVVTATNKNFTFRSIKEHLDHLLKLWAKEDLANLRKSGTEEQYEEKEQLLQHICDLHREYKLVRTTENYDEGRRRKGIEARNSAAYNYATIIYADDSESTQHIIHNEELDETIVTEQHCAANVYDTSANENIDPSSIVISDTTESTSSNILEGVARSRKRRLHSITKTSALDFVKERHRKELQIQEKELQLQERKLELEEKKLRLEEEKFNLERKERESHLSIEVEERKHRMKMSEQQQHMIDILLDFNSNKH